MPRPTKTVHNEVLRLSATINPQWPKMHVDIHREEQCVFIADIIRRGRDVLGNRGAQNESDVVPLV